MNKSLFISESDFYTAVYDYREDVTPLNVLIGGCTLDISFAFIFCPSVSSYLKGVMEELFSENIWLCPSRDASAFDLSKLILL